MQSNIFRKVSIDRLSSPEQLDQLMQVTTARGWLALSGVGLVLAGALAWGIFGRLPENVGGQGILLKSGGVFEVVPNASGLLDDIAVSVGDSVNEGQVIARLAQPELVDQVQQARLNLHNLRDEHARLFAYGTKDAALQRAYLQQERENLRHRIRSSVANLQGVTERVANQVQLVDKGLLTKQSLLQTRQQEYDARERIRTDSGQLTQNAVKLLSLTNDKQRDVESSRTRVQEAERKLAELQRQLALSSEVRTPYSGRVLELMSGQGSIVNRGEVIVSLDLTGRTVKDLEAVIFVPSIHGKKLRPGMRIQISPSTVRAEEYGFMLARVTYVSDFPATGKGMQRVLKNEHLASALAGDGAPYEVHADLVPDAETVSHYRWSSSKGPPVQIRSGTLANALITVNEQRPLSMVLPLLRQYTGL